jgi:hypothetical protein
MIPRIIENITCKHSYTSITTLAPLVDSLQRSEQIFFVDTELSSLLQGTSEDVQQCLAVRISVDMSMRFVIKVVS